MLDQARGLVEKAAGDAGMLKRSATNPDHLQAPAGHGSDSKLDGRMPLQLTSGVRQPQTSGAPLALIRGAFEERGPHEFAERAFHPLAEQGSH